MNREIEEEEEESLLTMIAENSLNQQQEGGEEISNFKLVSLYLRFFYFQVSKLSFKEILSKLIHPSTIVNEFLFFPPDFETYNESNPTKIVFYKNIAIQYFPAIDKDVETTIVYSHGNACDIGTVYPYLDYFQNVLGRKYNVISYDYTGYGLSEREKKSTEDLVYKSIGSVIEYCINEKGINPSDIILFGKSIGCAPSIYIGQKYRFRGIVLESPFKSCVRVVFDYSRLINWCLDWFLDIFNNYYNITNVSDQTQIFLIHGTKDDIVPFNHSVDLWKYVNNKYKFLQVDGADHNNVENVVGIDKYFKMIDEFIQDCYKMN